MFAINEEENTTQCKLIQHRGYGGRRAGKGTAPQKLPKAKYKAREKHVAHPSMDEQDKGVELVPRHCPRQEHLPFPNRYHTAIRLDQKTVPSRAPAQHTNRPPWDTKQNKAFWKRVNFNISAAKYLEISRRMLSWATRLGLS